MKNGDWDAVMHNMFEDIISRVYSLWYILDLVQALVFHSHLENCALLARPAPVRGDLPRFGGMASYTSNGGAMARDVLG